MPRCLFQISSKRMYAYFEGGHLLCVALNKLENGLVGSGNFTAFTKSGERKFDLLVVLKSSHEITLPQDQMVSIGFSKTFQG